MKDIKPVDDDLPLEVQEEGDPLQVLVEGKPAQVEEDILEHFSYITMAPVSRSVRQRRAARKIHPWCPRRFWPDPKTPKATVGKSSGPRISPIVNKMEALAKVTNTPPQLQAATCGPSPTLNSGERTNIRTCSPVEDTGPLEWSPLFPAEVAAWLPSPTSDIMEACVEMTTSSGIETLPTANAVAQFIKAACDNRHGMEPLYTMSMFHQPEAPLQKVIPKPALTRRQRRNRRRVSIAVGPGQFLKMSRKEAEAMGLVQPQCLRLSRGGDDV